MFVDLQEILKKPPVSVNPAGTRWWPHPEIAEYAKRYPELKNYAYWIIEDVNQVRHFVITQDQQYVKISQSIEDICLTIDLLGKRHLT